MATVFNHTKWVKNPSELYQDPSISNCPKLEKGIGLNWVSHLTEPHKKLSFENMIIRDEV